MKIKHLLIGMLAMAAAAACQEEVPVVEPVLEVDKAEVSVAATAGEATFKVTANNAWTATADADWVTLDPAAGEGAAEAVAVKVTAEDNTAEEARTATVTVKSGELTKTVKVAQAAAEAEEPGPVVETKTYVLVGDAVGGWDVDNNGVVLTLDGTTDGYYVAKSVAVTAKKGMHFTKNNKWEGNVKGLHGLIAPNEIGEVGGNDISLTEGGNYDVYLTEALDKFYFMSAGKLPSEAVEHQELAVTWGVIGATVEGAWDKDYIMTQEGEWYVAKGVEFAELNFKVRGNSSWADDVKWGREAEDTKCALNVAIPASTCADYRAANTDATDNPGIYIEGAAGTYDVYFSPEKKEIWVMTAGYKPGDDVPAPADVDIDGKQWAFTWQAMGGAACVIDLGVTEPGTAILAYDMGVLDPSYAGIYYPYMMGSYTVTKTDGTSGVVTLSADGSSVEIPYSEATENTVHFAAAALLEEDVDCTLATTKIEIALDAAQGLADGEYWIMANDKVATPLAGNYGYIQVVDAVDGKSTAANAFTFTQVDAGLYTIQDSNGKYYYQTGTYNSFNVSDTDEGTDAYLWEVYDSGNGQYVIMNYEVGKFVQYDTNFNSYGSYSDERGVLPTLVLAEDPIAEPEPEEPSADAAKYETNVTCTTVSSSNVDGVATVNGVADVFTLKFGTSKKYGEATITLPAGTTKVNYYAVAWKSTPSKLEFSVGGTVVGTQEIAANDGASGSSPYTITVTDSDYYTFTLPSALEAETVVTVKTVETGYRAILFGIQAE